MGIVVGTITGHVTLGLQVGPDPKLSYSGSGWQKALLWALLGYGLVWNSLLTLLVAPATLLSGALFRDHRAAILMAPWALCASG